MVTWIWGKTGSNNGLVPEGTFISKVFCVVHLRAISQDVLINSIHNINSNIEHLKLPPNLPGANGLFLVLKCIAMMYGYRTYYIYGKFAEAYNAAATRRLLSLAYLPFIIL